MKKLLFVINTLGTGGAEVALTELLKRIDTSQYEVSLFVLLNQGELIHAISGKVRLLNTGFDDTAIHTDKGLKRVKRKAFKSLFKKLNFIRYAGYLLSNLAVMVKEKSVRMDKLMWRVVSEGAERFDERYDVAIAYIEGGSTYYVADHVKADVKKVFVHTDYSLAGYSRRLDTECYKSFDKIYAVSDTVKESFLKAYPELVNRTEVFKNLIDIGGIEQKSCEPGGFSDDYPGIRILSIGRLSHEKSFEIAIDAMEMIVKGGTDARWYVLGEGNLRQALEERIRKRGLADRFLLLGNCNNPYPYLKQCDIYVQASRYEGKSMAIQEAKVLKCPVVVTDCGGNREQIEDGIDGLICDISAQDMYEKITKMLSDPVKAKEMGAKARENIIKDSQSPDGIERLLSRK